MASTRWRKVKLYKYFLHLCTGNSFRTWRRALYSDENPAKLSPCKKGILFTYNIFTSHLGLLVILAIHTLVGALIFREIEGKTGRPSDYSKIEKYTNMAKTNLMQDLVNEGLVDLANQTELREALNRHFRQYQKRLIKNNILSSKPAAKELWTISGAAYYCVTVYSTVGYGDIAPVTTLGRWITVIYAIIGVPIFVITIADLSMFFTLILQALAAWIRVNCRRTCCMRRKQTNFNSNSTHKQGTGTVQKKEAVITNSKRQHKNAVGFINRTATEANLTNLIVSDKYEDIVAKKLQEFSEQGLPLYVPILITCGYTLLVTVFFMSSGGWTFTESFYFVFISFTTIGFGDIVPKSRSMFLSSLVVYIMGLMFVGMMVSTFVQITNNTLSKAKDRVDKIAEEKLGSSVMSVREQPTPVKKDYKAIFSTTQEE